MNSVTSSCAETRIAIPSTLNSSSEWYSPCPASRGARARQDMITVASAATAQIMSISRARSSIASAPETIEAGLLKRQISVPIAPARTSSASVGTTRSRTTALRSNPASSTISAPPASTISGDRDAQSMCGPVTWWWVTTTSALLVEKFIDCRSPSP